MLTFKAIELDIVSKKRTGREHTLAADNRDAAIDRLLEKLGFDRVAARVDPNRTLVQVDARLWSIVRLVMPPADETGVQRRAGAKHKRVR